MVTKIGKKAVLVYPQFNADTFWSIHRTLELYIPPNEFGYPKAMFPPLALLELANYLKKNGYYEEIELIDMNIDRRDLSDRIKSDDPVFISAMLTQENAFREVAKDLKNRGIVTIGGGPLIDERMRGVVDHLVINESEMVIDDLLEGLLDGRAEEIYRGTYTPPDKILQPDYSFINPNNYLTMLLEDSRGCVHNCEYCTVPENYGGLRYVPWHIIKAAILQFYKLGWRGPVLFTGDNSIAKPKETNETMKKVYELEEEIGFHFPKIAQVTMAIANETKLMKKTRNWYKRINVDQLFIGWESNSESALKETGKYVNLVGEKTPEQKLWFISKETGASTMIGAMHGFDSDTNESVRSLGNSINRTNAVNAMFSFLIAFPGTPLYHRLNEEFRIRGEITCNTSDGVAGFIPENTSAKEAEENHVKLLKNTYNERAFFKRVMRELRLINPYSPQNTLSFDDGLYSVKRILTKYNSQIFKKYLGPAILISALTSRFSPSRFFYKISKYFSHCAEFTHFKAQAHALEEQQKNRVYESWQLYSWKQIQESPVASIDIIEPNKDTLIYDTVKMQLRNGYEFTGTRLDALRHFVGPYLKQKLRGIQVTEPAIGPTIEQFIDVHLRVYHEAHSNRPEILNGLDFATMEKDIRSNLLNKSDYLRGMKALFEHARRTA